MLFLFALSIAQNALAQHPHGYNGWKGSCTASPKCRFAPAYTEAQILANPEPFICDLLYWEGHFTQPGIGFNGANAMTYDGTLLNTTTGLADAYESGQHNFSAASKESLHVMLLAHALAGDASATRVVSPDNPAGGQQLAFHTMEQKLASYLFFNQTFPGFGGFLPWFNNTLGQPLRPTSDWVNRVPALDNGELLWAVYAAVHVLQTSPDPAFRTLGSGWQSWLDYTKRHAAAIFYRGNGKVCAVTTLNQTLLPTDPKQNYTCEGIDVLNDPYEGELFAWWLYFFGGLDEVEKGAIWVAKRAQLVGVEYTNQNGSGLGPITVQKGFWFSAHEQWKVLEMPYYDVDIVRRVFTNAERVRTCNSASLGIPGMYASVNNVTDATGQIIGYISNAGVPSVANQTLQELDVVTPYSVFPTLLVEGGWGRRVGMVWWWNMVRARKMQNPYGSTESERLDGTAVSSFVSWDSKVTTVVALLGGVSGFVRVKMMEEGIYNEFINVTNREYSRVFTDLEGEDVALCLPIAAVPDAGLADYTDCS
ncbi:hypothetical protein LTR78_003853 [Recurvomyces mirabilis]|uniref:Endo-beta-1,2-glucanase SGL domain-containing protein n=1 Tax=Recurvomyces mirabilis TaxID=574656 RepID=A0AAE0WQG1_9PEZI|nr:hypothetical protein LTR78_003853 [Recurvomyces mirabilis]KAK5154008.1 hypothetical protein LTS14_007228 [Recurvomyces mirabilis]